jgi:hypothetical protein
MRSSNPASVIPTGGHPSTVLTPVQPIQLNEPSVEEIRTNLEFSLQ